MIAGNDSLLDIGEFSQALNQNQLRSLRATRSAKTGKFLAPSESTIRRVLQALEDSTNGAFAGSKEFARLGRASGAQAAELILIQSLGEFADVDRKSVV